MTWAGKEDGTSCKELHQTPGCTLYSLVLCKEDSSFERLMVQQSSIFWVSSLLKMTAEIVGAAKVFASSWEFKTYLSKTY
jgi:hypothetical protein